jgi:hypothetical protein
MSKALLVLNRIEEARRKGGPVLTVSQMSEAVNNRGEPPRVNILRTTPLMGNKTLTVKGEAMGTKLYPLTATFYNVDYSWEKDPEHPLVVRPELGRVGYMKPIGSTENPAQVRCKCPDFRHTYAHWDKEQRALSGPRFPAYQRKTTWMPERNPEHKPGVCKHIMGLFERLRRDKILV